MKPSTSKSDTTKSAPLRVAMVHYRDSADCGGSLRVGETIANHVDPDRIAVEMVYAYGGPGPVTKDSRVPCHFLGSRGPKDFPSWVRARAFFKEMRPDIIHFQDAVVWLRTALAGTPYLKIVHIHARHQIRPKGEEAGAYKTHPFNASQTARAFLKSTDAQVCINHGARKALLDLGWIRPERSYVVYNSVDASRSTAVFDRVRARTELGLPADALLLGMICRLVWEKGCADLFSIIERLPTGWHGVICGDGPQKEELQRECAARGLANRIHFIGTRDNVVPVYAALNAYAFLSPYEPFGLVLAEAMASQVPIFGIRGDGEFDEVEYPLITDEVADLIPFARAGNYQLTVPAEVFDKVAVKLSLYGACPERYGGMIERAHTWAKACFDAPIQAEAMTRVYENVFAQADSSKARLVELYETTRKAGEALAAINDRQSSTTATA